MLSNMHDFFTVASMTETEGWRTSSFDSLSSLGENDISVGDARAIPDMFDPEDLMAIQWLDDDDTDEKVPKIHSCDSAVCCGREECFNVREALYVSESDDESMCCSTESLSEVIRGEGAIRMHSPPHGVTENTVQSIPDELICEILKFLDVSSLSSTMQVSRRFRSCGRSDEAGWLNHFTALRRTKLHISQQAIETTSADNAMTAYSMAWRNSLRHEITLPELCYDQQNSIGTIWHFRFKEAAGHSWTSFDPWHSGGQCRKMVFLTDGTVKELIGATDSSASMVDPFSDAPAHIQNLPAHVGMNWRFLPSPMDMPSRPKGAYLRLNVAGRDVPTYITRRSPTGNWGFVIENCWGVFASFPLPTKDETGGGTPLRPTRMRLRRTSDGGVRWLNVQGMESDSEDEEEMTTTPGARSTEEGRLLADRALPTTSRFQWREALLYNYGSILLPEGESAREEFDRIFESYRHPIQSLGRTVR